MGKHYFKTSPLSLSQFKYLNKGSDIYNALTIHGLAQLSVLPESVLRVHQFWKTTGYNIAGHDYCLDDIEHGILRGEWKFYQFVYVCVCVFFFYIYPK